MSENKAILCGICGAPIAFRVEAEPDGQAGCAACDNWANQDDIRKIVGEYVQDEGQMIINRKMRDAARGSKIMKFTGKTKSDKVHRFRVDLKL